MNGSTIEKYGSLLNDFSKIVDPLNVDRIKDYKALLLSYEPLVAKRAEEYKLTAPEYNIFKVLNIHWLETKLHTPFLVNLLNPLGTHEQGVLFYNEFLNQLPNVSSIFKIDDPKEIQITEEKSTPNGRIDIFIESSIKDKKFIIIIENKIYAGDQENQLERYYNYYLKQGFTDQQILIIYLKDGENPSSTSIKKELRERLSANDILINMSYKEDVASWLINCKEAISPPNLKIILKQYIEIIKTL